MRQPTLLQRGEGCQDWGSEGNVHPVDALRGASCNQKAFGKSCTGGVQLLPLGCPTRLPMSAARASDHRALYRLRRTEHAANGRNRHPSGRPLFSATAAAQVALDRPLHWGVRGRSTRNARLPVAAPACCSRRRRWYAGGNRDRVNGRGRCLIGSGCRGTVTPLHRIHRLAARQQAAREEGEDDRRPPLSCRGSAA